jgi:hypothetical protein
LKKVGEMAIAQINAIVHQLFYQTSGGHFLNDYLEFRPLNKTERALTQNELHQYGLIIKKTKANPNAILILVDTNLGHNPIDQKAISVRNNRAPKNITNAQNRFVAFAKRELGNRLIVLPWGTAHPATAKDTATELITKGLEKIRFAKTITIEVTGQHKDWCVQAFRRRIRNSLRQRGHYIRTQISTSSKSLAELKLQYQQAREKKQTAYVRWRRKNTPKTKKIKFLK